MNDIIMMVIGIYIAYALLYAILHKDMMLITLDEILSQSRDGIQETLIEVEEKNLSELIKNDIFHPDEGTKDSAGEAIVRLNKLKKDKDFLDKSADIFISDLKTISITRRIKTFFWVIVRDLYTLIPMAVLMYTGNLKISIIGSFTLMFLFSMFEDYMLRISISELFGEEVSDGVMSSFSARMGIVITAMTRQSHFYATLLILLYK
mgnify:FL=1